MKFAAELRFFKPPSDYLSLFLCPRIVSCTFFGTFSYVEKNIE
jgi:hypothetical protein